MPAGTCPNCGWPRSEPYEIVSTHRTSEGVVIYTRCVCGSLQVRMRQRAGEAWPFAEGSPAEPFAGRPARCG